MDSEYGRRYAELYSRHWWWRARERVVLRELERLKPAGGWNHVLDVGSGDGLFFDVLDRYGRSVEGVEPDAALVSEENAVSRRVHVMPFDESFRPDHRFGLIVFLDVLEHMTRSESALAHAAALLEPGGVIVVTVPAFQHLWTTHDDLNHHVRRYTTRSLHALLASALEVERCRYFFHWPYAAKLAMRATETVLRPRPKPPAVPSARLNRLLLGVCALEQTLIGGLPLPFGSSIIAVARKRE